MLQMDMQQSLPVAKPDISHIQKVLIGTNRGKQCEHCGLMTRLVIEVVVDVNKATIENTRYRCTHCSMDV
jgi:hypothetical protein